MTARERARALGLPHVEFEAGDIASVAFARGAFDVVLGRWSLIYVDDVAGSLTRLRESLVPGGRIAVAAWAPADSNPWITTPLDVLSEVHAAPARSRV